MHVPAEGALTSRLRLSSRCFPSVELALSFFSIAGPVVIASAGPLLPGVQDAIVSEKRFRAAVYGSDPVSPSSSSLPGVVKPQRISAGLTCESLGRADGPG